MPFEYTILAPQRVVYARSTDRLSASDILTLIRRLRQDPALNPDFDSIIDMTPTQSFESTGDEIAKAASDSAFSMTSRRAMVAPDSLGYGMARIYAAYRELRGQSAIQVFNDLRSACAWLGIDPSAIAAV